MIALPWPARAGLAGVAALVLLLLYGPLLVAIFFSFFAMKRNQVQWDSASLDAYAALMRNQGIIDALVNTLIVGVGAVALALVFGTALAFHYHNGRGRAREWLQVVVFMPFLMPPIITGLSLLIFFRQIDLDRSLLTVVIGHMVFVLALVYRTVLTRLQTLSRSLVEASLDLGANPWQTFRHVLMPNLATALASAAILSFALSFDETVITLLVTGTKNTLPLRLWGMMRMGFTPDINALVTLVLAATTGLCLIATRILGLPGRS
jgi:putative spermidine/putrescine transport system permease protein/spermidine/putrescine transport system permease protein